ncbi:conjugal transfer protein TraD [Rhizobium rhizogenes]|uniref:conjugal transfer protein TraD n=1 Tax=Rhizobium rhizogenes TaxID=359 RepID=UPI001572B7B3|nr:conjugal transfer protein TraD [Rhizobium rhizogenes]NTF50345.1 conjugal transfer protein TraD [Rhizobium rhizogenes]NTH07725.1 conjugal transfer protein TraD [Rhizobium rhizogenes]
MSGERKRDARQKLLLGGLVVRAGLAEADRAFLLGALLELVKVSLTSDEYRRLREIGETAFKVPSRESETPRPEDVS